MHLLPGYHPNLSGQEALRLSPKVSKSCTLERIKDRISREGKCNISKHRLTKARQMEREREPEERRQEDAGRMGGQMG